MGPCEKNQFLWKAANCVEPFLSSLDALFGERWRQMEREQESFKARVMARRMARKHKQTNTETNDNHFIIEVAQL